MTDVLDRVRATGLLAEGESVVVLLSGGRDSVCLLDCAVEALGAGRVSALHANYGLRAEAGEDERHCAALCERFGVSLTIERAELPPGNVQARAREVRFAAARRLGATIATGHTATDQVETILYRLAASPGRRALLGMNARDGDVIRPLLHITREETAEHNRQRGLTWREDASNGVSTRGRIRAELVPALESLHPAAQRNVLRTAELLRDEAAVLDDVVQTALAGRDEVELSTLAALPRALARLVLRTLAEDAAGTLCARAPARLDEILRLDGALDLGDGVRAVVDRGMLRIVPTPPLPSRMTHA